MHGFLSSNVNYSPQYFILAFCFAWILCTNDALSQNLVNINRPYSNPPNSSISVQNISGTGAVKNYGTMSFSNLSMGSDTVYNYGNLTIVNANNGVIVNMGTCSFQASNFNSSVVIINQSNGNLSFTAPNIYLNNYVCNAGFFQFNTLALNNQGTFYNCGSSDGNITNAYVSGYYTEASCGVCAYISPLPVILSYFKVAELYKEHTLIWETVSEINADYFEVYSSSDFVNWIPYRKIQAAGNSNQPRQYHLPVQPSEQIQYFKLKQVDFSGESYDLGMVSLVADKLDYSFMSNSISTINPSKLILRDLLGRTLRSCNECTSLSWNDLPSGTYILTINSQSLKLAKLH